MVYFAHDGLKLWYGTPDAPAPDGTTERRQGVSVTVGVRPSNPSNAVSVRYRVDGRGVEAVSAPLVANDFQGRAQYFRAMFPTFWSGETVEYLPVVSCEGRRAPDPATASTFPSAFRLSEASAAVPASRPPESSAEPRAMVVPSLEHLVHVRVSLTREPELIGETPAGFVINWPPLSGTLDGPAFHATVIPGGEHQTIVRTDGIGILSASVSVETHDRILIALRHSGTVDFGEGWSSRRPPESWPEVLPVRTHIRLLTADPRYRWLNRVHCLTVGQVRLPERLYTYDMYAVR
jgi:hypothetical protein